jgi:L-asparaginase
VSAPVEEVAKRPVRVIAVGGTIAMRGEKAVPTVDAAGLVAELAELAEAAELAAETAFSTPGAHLSLRQALEVAHRARDVARAGEGVVVTTGTDTLEELAVLCAMVHAAESPVVLTGASRPGSRPGADGPANLLDAVALASAPAAAGLGTAVVFGGEIHDAMTVRKVDSTSPAGFGSPNTGPLGRIVEGRVWLHACPIPPPALEVPSLEHRVAIVTSVLGDDGELLGEVAASHDGVVLAALGAGHLSPSALAELRTAVAQIPVVVTCRPERASMLFSTYGFEGSEADVRATGAVCAPFLSPPAARIVLLCCLGAGLDGAATARVFEPWDAASA